MANHTVPARKRRKTVDQRFADWWKRNTYLWQYEMPRDEGDLRNMMRCAYANGWAARTRTKR